MNMIKATESLNIRSNVIQWLWKKLVQHASRYVYWRDVFACSFSNCSKYFDVCEQLCVRLVSTLCFTIYLLDRQVFPIINGANGDRTGCYLWRFISVTLPRDFGDVFTREVASP